MDDDHLRNTQLCIENNILLYKAIQKSILLYGIQLWVTVSNSNIDIFLHLQNKVMHMMVDASYHTSNILLQRYIVLLSIKDEIKR